MNGYVVDTEKGWIGERRGEREGKGKGEREREKRERVGERERNKRSSRSSTHASHPYLTFQSLAL